eukprot:XP_017177365.1 PREDICTED: basic salivary proline-rich protein 2-like [Mus musculus]
MYNYDCFITIYQVPDIIFATAQPYCPSPPPARASCHVAQGRAARLCGAGPRGGPEPGSASSPPPLAGGWTQLARTRANGKGQFSGPREPIRRRGPAGGGGRPRPHVQLASPHLPPAPPSGQSEAAGGCALRLPLTDRRLTPTKTRHLCFHTRREEKKPISDETSAGSAPPLPPPPRAMAASGGDFSAPFSLPLRLLQGGPHSCPPPACPFQRHDSYPAVSQNGSTTLGGPAAAAHPRKRTKPPSRQSPDPLPSRGSLRSRSPKAQPLL